MNLKKSIVVTGTFVGLHCWPEAPNEVSYLANYHRHLFTYKVYFRVDQDRQLEFHLMKEAVAQSIDFLQSNSDVRNWSCERWAEQICRHRFDFTLNPQRVEIWEDGECGAIVEME